MTVKLLLALWTSVTAAFFAQTLAERQSSHVVDIRKSSLSSPYRPGVDLA